MYKRQVFALVFGDSSALTIYVTGFLAIPSISVGTRRLRDVNKSGWWQLLWILVIIGWIPLVIWLCRKSKETITSKKEKVEEKTIPFLDLAKEGITNWKAWTLGSITIIIFWQIIGTIPFGLLEDVSTKNDINMPVSYTHLTLPTIYSV